MIFSLLSDQNSVFNWCLSHQQTFGEGKFFHHTITLHHQSCSKNVKCSSNAEIELTMKIFFGDPRISIRHKYNENQAQLFSRGLNLYLPIFICILSEEVSFVNEQRRNLTHLYISCGSVFFFSSLGPFSMSSSI